MRINSMQLPALRAAADAERWADKLGGKGIMAIVYVILRRFLGATEGGHADGSAAWAVSVLFLRQ